MAPTGRCEEVAVVAAAAAAVTAAGPPAATVCFLPPPHLSLNSSPVGGSGGRWQSPPRVCSP